MTFHQTGFKSFFIHIHFIAYDFKDGIVGIDGILLCTPLFDFLTHLIGQVYNE